MNKTNCEIKDISINDIIVYEDNPRNIPAINQIDEINKMIEAHLDKTELSRLAESFINDGQSPFDNIGVVFSTRNKKYVAIEGNRRITALKLFQNPELAAIDASTMRSFKNLRNKYSVDSLPETLRCAILASIEDGATWIDIKHTGLNNGLGVRPWDRTQKERWSRNLGDEPDKAFLVCEYLRGNQYFHQDILPSPEDISNTSTLNRMLDDPDFLAGLFLSIDSDRNFKSSDDNKSAELLEIILTELNSKTLSVKKVYLKEDRKAYLEHLYERVGLVEQPKEQTPGTPIAKGQPSTFNTPPIDPPPTADKPSNTSEQTEIEAHPVAKTPSYPANDRRSKLTTPPTSKITGITSQKGISVYEELKKIPCDRFPIASMFAIRVFMEITFKEFLDATNKYQKTMKSNLSIMLKVCHETIMSHGNDKQKLHAQEIIISTSNGQPYIDEIEALNIAVHSHTTYSSKNDVFAIWDKYVPFLQDLWEYKNKIKKN